MTNRLLVRGAGLMGASVGLAARESGWDVEIEDVDAKATQAAAAVTGLQILRAGFEPHIVVVAVPPELVAEVVIESLRLYPKSTVIDIASVKTELKVQVESISDTSDKYVPTHPMAGKSVSGAANASVDLLMDRRWVICERNDTSSEDLQIVEQLVRDCGSTPIYMSTEAHDEAVAVTSHLPQVLSTVLAKQLNHLSDQEVSVSGPGLRDMTRLASSDVTLWTQIIKSNYRYINQAISSFIGDLQSLQKALSTKDFSQVTKLLSEGQIARNRVPGKHGDRQQSYAVVSVLIDDKPGQLAGIFQCAGQANINIEDVRIDHALGREVAIIELSIKPENVKAMQNALVAEGWTLRQNSTAD